MRRLAVIAMFLVAACGSATASAHTLSLAYKAGDTYRYSLHFVLNYTIGLQSLGMTVPLVVDLSGKEAVKVNSVDKSGVADVTITLTDLSSKTTVNGTTTTTTTSSQTVSVKIASDGHIVSVNGNATGNGVFPGTSGTDSGFVSAILPDKPVKPGDTWSKSYDQSNFLGSAGMLHVSSDNKYVKDGVVNNVSAAVVESVITGSIDVKLDMSALGGSSGSPLLPSGGGVQSLSMKGTTKSDVTSYIDVGAHRILKSHSTGSVDATLTFNLAPGSKPQPGLSGPITFKGTQTLDMNPA